jgi:hypothetical protein
MPCFLAILEVQQQQHEGLNPLIHSDLNKCMGQYLKKHIEAVCALKAAVLMVVTRMIEDGWMVGQWPLGRP